MRPAPLVYIFCSQKVCGSALLKESGIATGWSRALHQLAGPWDLTSPKCSEFFHVEGRAGEWEDALKQKARNTSSQRCWAPLAFFFFFKT